MASGLVPKRELDAMSLKHVWVPPGKGWVDKVKEIQADQLAVDAGFKTISQVLTESGVDPDEFIEERKDEIARFVEAEIPVQMSNMSRSEMPEEPEAEDAEAGEPEPAASLKAAAVRLKEFRLAAR